MLQTGLMLLIIMNLINHFNMKALERIGWRFSQGKAFKPNDNDINAYNELVDYYEKTSNEIYNANELFAKLYIYVYMRLLERRQATVMDKGTRKRMYDMITKPMPNIIQEFTQSLNASEFYSLCDGLDIEARKHTSESKIKEDSKKLENVKDKAALKGQIWDEATVSECLMQEVNQAIEYAILNTPNITATHKTSSG